MRLSIRKMLLVVGFIGFAFAALGQATVFWMSLTVTLAFGFLVWAAIAAALASGPERVFAIGALIAGGAYGYMLVPVAKGGMSNEVFAKQDFLLTNRLLLWGADQLGHQKFFEENMWSPSSLQPSTQWISATVPPVTTVVTKNQGRFLMIGHMLFLLLFGIAGGAFARWRYAAATDSPSE